jgi:hypothetical protein
LIIFNHFSLFFLPHRGEPFETWGSAPDPAPAGSLFFVFFGPPLPPPPTEKKRGERGKEAEEKKRRGERRGE